MSEILLSKEAFDAAARASSTTEHGDAFAEFLMGRVSDAGVNPLGYIMMENLAIMDLIKGVDGFTGERIGRASGLPEIAYKLMARCIRGNLPEEFRAVVEREEKAVLEDVEKEL